MDVVVAARVEHSAIAGHGLFAERPIPAGTAVARFASPPAAVTDLGRLNHSCDPVLGWTADGTLAAMRDIAAGAELTTDYALAIATPGALVWCHCGTYRCRQVIEGEDWQIPQLQQRYAGWWSPAVAARVTARSASGNGL